MKVTMIKCDNPACTTIEHAEEGGTAANPNPPYGWLFVEKYGFMGCGPYFTKLKERIVVCSIDCLSPAMRETIDERNRLEREGYG